MFYSKDHQSIYIGVPGSSRRKRRRRRSASSRDDGDHNHDDRERRDQLHRHKHHAQEEQGRYDMEEGGLDPHGHEESLPVEVNRTSESPCMPSRTDMALIKGNASCGLQNSISEGRCRL